jgi:hypothetical protein
MFQLGLATCPNVLIPASVLMLNASVACSTSTAHSASQHKGEKVMRTSLMRTSLLTPILLALLFGAASSTFGEPLNPQIFYQIKVQHSGKCLEVAGEPGSLWNGAPVVQGTCDFAENQQWKFTPLGPTDEYSITARHSGKVMDVFGGIFSLGNNVDVQQRDYNGLANQRWLVIDRGDGFYKILAKHSGLSLNIRGGTDENGAQAIQWPWAADYTNEQWILTPLPIRRACAVTDPLMSTFAGPGELTTTHPNAPGPFPSNVNLTVKFTDCRASISITNFPPIPGSSENPPNTSTVTMIGGGSGSFDSSNGRIVIPITLKLENSNILFGNSTLPLTLRAEGVDMENPATGQVTLRGTGTFVGGALNGSRGTLVFTGAFSPRPR